MTRLLLCGNNQSFVRHRIMLVNDMLAMAILNMHLSLIAAIVVSVIKRMIVSRAKVSVQFVCVCYKRRLINGNTF